jgi:hypothetical protein
MFLFLVIALNLTGCMMPKQTEIVESFTLNEPVVIKEKIKTEWYVFVEALIWVESNGISDAIGKTNDAGILQITPIYVKEVNRLMKHQKYNLQDRFSPEKSMEMFEIINDFKNPEKDIKLAIKIHNPRAPESYERKIMAKMKEIKQQENLV